MKKNAIDTNDRLKKFCNQKNIASNTNINNKNVAEYYLHLTEKSNSMVAQNFIRYLQSRS